MVIVMIVDMYVWCCCFQRFFQVEGEADVGTYKINLRCTSVSGERVTSTISATNSKGYFEHFFHDEFICFDGVLKMFEQDFFFNTVESFTHVEHDKIDCFVFGADGSFYCHFCSKYVLGGLSVPICRLRDGSFSIESASHSVHDATASIFLCVDMRMMALRFDTGPFGFPGFCSGI